MFKEIKNKKSVIFIVIVLCAFNFLPASEDDKKIDHRKLPWWGEEQVYRDIWIMIAGEARPEAENDNRLYNISLVNKGIRELILDYKALRNPLAQFMKKKRELIREFMSDPDFLTTVRKGKDGRIVNTEQYCSTKLTPPYEMGKNVEFYSVEFKDPKSYRYVILCSGNKILPLLENLKEQKSSLGLVAYRIKKSSFPFNSKKQGGVGVSQLLKIQKQCPYTIFVTFPKKLSILHMLIGNYSKASTDEQKALFKKIKEVSKNYPVYVNMSDIRGNRPLHYAYFGHQTQSNKSLQELLEKAGAETDVENKEGKVPNQMNVKEIVKGSLKDSGFF